MPAASPSHPISVILADDHDLVRAGIRALLTTVADVTVLAEARNGDELLALLERHQPDLVITDISMPGMDGISAVVQIQARHPGTRVLVLSMYDTVDFVRRAVASGASGYLMKDCAPDELGHAVRSIVETGSYFSSAIAQKLLQQPARTAFDDLTERQLEVLTRIAKGLSAKEIAWELGLSPKTVDVHRARVMERLQVNDIAGLTRYAVRMGLVTA
jgi:DNA-binding NarL/FixJ family response regulator